MLIDYETTTAETTVELGGSVDFVDLQFYSSAAASLGQGDILTVTTAKAPPNTNLPGLTSSIQLAGDYTGDTFSVSVNPAYAPFASGTEVTVLCLAAGTLILTAHGEVPVEALQPGDLVVTRSGPQRPLKWLGRRHLTCTHHPRPATVWPIRIAPHTFGPDQPRRPLWVSPDHCLYLEGHLIPARELVNGGSIRQVRVPEVHYWHVELETHDIILAEGLPVESYLEAGQRGSFTNGGVAVQLHPSFAAAAWETACAPPAVVGEVVEVVRGRLMVASAAIAA